MENLSNKLKLLFNCCLLSEEKIVFSSISQCSLCNSMFISFPLCAGFSRFIKILKSVPSRWIPTCYVQFSSPSFSGNFWHTSFKGNVHVLASSLWWDHSEWSSKRCFVAKIWFRHQIDKQQREAFNSVLKNPGLSC